MPIIFFITQRSEVFLLPKLFKIGRYIVFFWSNENDEPIHVHIAIGSPSPNATKIWLTRSGGCIVANNASRISQKDLAHLIKIIQTEHLVICDKWKIFFDIDAIKFYC